MDFNNRATEQDEMYTLAYQEEEGMYLDNEMVIYQPCLYSSL